MSPPQGMTEDGDQACEQRRSRGDLGQLHQCWADAIIRLRRPSWVPHLRQQSRSDAVERHYQIERDPADKGTLE